MIDTEHNLLIGFIRDVNRLGFEHILIWGQIVVAILAVLTGMAINYLVRKKLHLTKIKGQGGVQRIIFPLSAFTIISIVNVSLQKIYPNLRFLDFINALLFALAVIRLMVYMMQVAFPNRVKDGRWLSTTIWIIFALYATGLAGFLQAGLDDVAFQYGKTRISLWNIIEATFVVAVTLLVSLSLSHLIENRLMRSTSGDMSMKVIIARLVKAGCIVLAFLIALPMVGIDLTVLSVFGGALGVGLGLGLQKIASNYVSGFILLMDRSLRIGDLIQIGDRAGQVSGLTARYIILKSLDGTASLIPNDTIITSVVINQTYTDRNVRVGIPIQVAYGSDLHLVMQLMMQATEGHSRILTNPPAGVVLKEFAESGINVELGFWVADSELGTGILRSQINLQIWESFVANNIEMPYPRRDISIVSMPHSE